MRTRRLRKAGAVSPTARRFLLTAVLPSLFVATTNASIVLSQFQEIGDFPFACNQAYLQPLADCHTSDFSPPDAPCTSDCFQDLLNITTLINHACKGIMANPQTLIGLFFEGKGASALCPVVISPPQEVSSAAPTAQPSTISNPPPAAATSTTSSASSMASKTFVMTSAAGAATTSAGVTSIAPVQPMSTGQGGGSASGVVAGGQSTQNAAGPTSTNGPGTFGGGAIPFTVSNIASRSEMQSNVGFALVSSGLVLALSLIS